MWATKFVCDSRQGGQHWLSGSEGSTYRLASCSNSILRSTSVACDNGQAIVHFVTVCICACVCAIFSVSILSWHWEKDGFHCRSISPRALLSRGATDSGYVLLKRLSTTLCYCASVQFPATPLDVIKQVRLVHHFGSQAIVLPLWLFVCISLRILCPLNYTGLHLKNVLPANLPGFERL